jgi:hypothetical protein
MKKEEIIFFNQLIVSLEDEVLSLEESYEKKKYKDFNKSKKFIIEMQKKVLEVMK